MVFVQQQVSSAGPSKRPKMELSAEQLKAARMDDVKQMYIEAMYLKVEPFFSQNRHIEPTALGEMHSGAVKSVFDQITADSKTDIDWESIPTPSIISALNAAFEVIKTENCKYVPNNHAVGIDLGTTYSCVAVYEQGQVKIIPNRNTGRNTTSSFVKFNTDRWGKVIMEVGDFVKEDSDESPSTVYDIKRIIGRRFNDPELQQDMTMWPFFVVDVNGAPRIKISKTKKADGEVYHPEVISSAVLTEMKQSAEIFLGVEVKKAVITVPAYFTDGQRQATIDAGVLAGLEVLKIINEPTAAALAYRVERKDLSPRNVLVFDFGGGTFDVSVLRMEDGEILVKAVGGDGHLGGEDIDHNLVRYCVQKYNDSQEKPIFRLNIGANYYDRLSRQRYGRRLRALKNECEEKKKALGHTTQVTIFINAIYRSRNLLVSITREEFEQLNMHLFLRAIGIMKDTIARANLNKEDIEDIILVGGTTRIPKVQELLRAFFGPSKRIVSRVNPDEAVAHGAAIQAAICNGEIQMGNPDYVSVRDVTPFSLGIEARGKDQNLKFCPIIPRNTPVPASITKDSFRTSNHNQTNAAIRVYQGESDKVEENILLGKFNLKVPPKEAGVERVKVSFDVDAQGILKVSATCISTGEISEIAIEANKMRLSKEDIQKLKNSVPRNVNVQRTNDEITQTT